MPVILGQPAAHTPRRIATLEWLRRLRRGASLAELYEGAFVMLDSASPPGFVRFVSHAVREVCNRLPDRLLGDSGDHLKHSKRLKEIDEAWPDRRQLDLPSVAAESLTASHRRRAYPARCCAPTFSSHR